MNDLLSTRSTPPADTDQPQHRCLQRNSGPGTLVGHTPILRVSSPFSDGGAGFWAKLEGFNPGGMKDRTAMHLVERARARGDLKSGARIVESTSGTLGLGLALAGTVYGLSLIHI